MLASVNANGVPGNSFSLHPNFSPDGTHLLFWSVSTNLVPGVPFGIEQLYMKDLTTGSVSLVSGDVNGVPGNGASFNPNNSCQVLMFSPDGTKVVFESAASNLVLGGTNLNIQIFIKDITTGAVTLVSAGVNGVQGMIAARISPFRRTARKSRLVPPPPTFWRGRLIQATSSSKI